MEHELSHCGLWSLGHMFSSCGTPALLPHSIWKLPGLRNRIHVPALAGRCLTNRPPGKSISTCFIILYLDYFLDLKQCLGVIYCLIKISSLYILWLLIHCLFHFVCPFPSGDNFRIYLIQYI